MKKGIIGKKIGMTQIFDEKGKVIPVTVNFSFMRTPSLLSFSAVCAIKLFLKRLHYNISKTYLSSISNINHGEKINKKKQIYVQLIVHVPPSSSCIRNRFCTFE